MLTPDRCNKRSSGKYFLHKVSFRKTPIRRPVPIPLFFLDYLFTIRDRNAHPHFSPLTQASESSRGGTSSSSIPRGAVTRRRKGPSFGFSHWTSMGPRGVGTLPRHPSRSPGCGATRVLAKPIVTGITPSTCVLRKYVGAPDQPWQWLRVRRPPGNLHDHISQNVVAPCAIIKPQSLRMRSRNSRSAPSRMYASSRKKAKNGLPALTKSSGGWRKRS